MIGDTLFVLAEFPKVLEDLDGSGPIDFTQRILTKVILGANKFYFPLVKLANCFIYELFAISILSLLKCIARKVAKLAKLQSNFALFSLRSLGPLA